MFSSPVAKILSPSTQTEGEEQAYSKAQFRIILGEEKEKMRREYDLKISKEQSILVLELLVLALFWGA